LKLFIFLSSDDSDVLAEVIQRRYGPTLPTPFGVLKDDPDEIGICASDGRLNAAGVTDFIWKKASRWLVRHGYGPTSMGLSVDGKTWVMLAAWPKAALGPKPKAIDRRAKLAAKMVKDFYLAGVEPRGHPVVTWPVLTASA
jgi:hypothetical protein